MLKQPLRVGHKSFKAPDRKAFNGSSLSVILSGEKVGEIYVTAVSEGLWPASVIMNAK